MRIATAKKKTSKNWLTKDITWEAFLNMLRTPLRTGETMREYKSMNKEEKGYAKEAAGGFVGGALNCGQRKTENVTARSMLTIDADAAKQGAWSKVTSIVEYRMACYSTHSHTEAHPRLRWIIPTDREMTPDEYPAVSRRVSQWLDIETIDTTTHEIARLMYFPTCSKDGPFEFHEQDGPILKVDEVLASYGENEAWRDASLWPAAKSESDVRAHATQKAGEPTEKAGMVGLFCRTYNVPEAIDEFLSDKYEPTNVADRYTYLGGTTAGGAIIYNDGAFLYSNHATDPTNGNSVNAFDLVRIHKFGYLDDSDELDVPVSKLPSYKAMCQWASELPGVKRQLVDEKSEEMGKDFGDLLGCADLDPAETDADEDDSAWKEQLEINSKTGECEPTINNGLLLMLHDPILKGAMGYDAFDEKPKLLRNVPWRKDAVKTDGRGTLWEDRDEAGLRWYLETKWKYKSELGVKNALELALQANRFHPVRKYLNGLVWDGEPRLDKVFVDYLGAEDTEYVRAVSRKWLCGAVARIMRPGCKFDQAIVLVGPQGVGKSTFADVISKGWFNDSEINMNGKDGYESLHGSWIIELAELASTKRSEVETVKTFISKREDTYRQSYGKRAASFPRQCVFFGTTNEQEFLRDRTGNRRWWTVNVSRIADADKLRENVDQVWAEAVVRWKEGEVLWLDDDRIKEQWEEEMSVHTVQDELVGQLQEYLDTKLPENWYDLSPENRRSYIQGDSVVSVDKGTMVRERVCVTEIRVEMLGEQRSATGNDMTSRRIANIMNTLPDWKKSKKKTRVPNYGPQWVFVRKKTSPIYKATGAEEQEEFDCLS